MSNVLSDVVKKGFEEMNRGNFSSSFSEAFGKVIERHFSEMRAEYPNLSYQMKAAVDRGNTVAFDWVATSTHAPTGRQVSWTGTGVVHVLNGRILAAKVIHDDMLRRDIQLTTIPRVGFGPLGGKWGGQILGLTVSMDLSHDEAGVWGAADIQNVGVSKFEGMTGDGAVKFKITLPSGEEHTFVGTLQGNDTIKGRVDGLDEEITFARQ
jgi:predicted ester cyclase